MVGKTLDQCYEAYAKEIFIYIYSFCKNRIIAEEIVQETFYRAYGYLENLEDERIKPWLFRVAYHAFIDYTRKERRHFLLEPEFFETHLKEPSFEHKLMEDEKIKVIFTQIEQLPFNQKQALVLSTIHHLSHREIATILDVTEAGVKSLIFRARTNLRKKQKGAL